MLYFYFGLAGIGIFGCVYLAIMLNIYKEKYKDLKRRDIFLAVVTLDGDKFEFRTGDEFYSATPRSDGTIEATKLTCNGVAIKDKKIYLMYSYLHWSDGYYARYDFCGKTEAEAIEKMRKNICCNNK